MDDVEMNDSIKKDNETRVYDILAQAAGEEPKAKIIKKSAKGCNDGVPLSFYEYPIAIFASDYNKRIQKNIPQIQLDRKRERMKTWVMHKRVINPILSKRIISEDKVRVPHDSLKKIIFDKT